MINYIAYSDGSSDNKSPDRIGGAAYIIFDSQGNEVKRMSKGFTHTSSNRMEILAIMSIVNSLPPNSFVTIHSDSQYSINVLSGRWKASENLDQINRYRAICSANNIKVDFIWVKGHNGNPYNELCDQMARGEYERLKDVFPKTKPKRKKKELPKDNNKLEEQYYNQITTKGRKKRTKK